MNNDSICRKTYLDTLVAISEHFLDAADGLSRVETFGAGLGAVHDGVAAVELEAVVQRLQTLLGLLVSRINNPTVGL